MHDSQRKLVSHSHGRRPPSHPQSPQFYRPNPRRRPRAPTRPGPASVCVSAFLNTTRPSHAPHSTVSRPPPPVRKEDGVLIHPSGFRVYLLAARAALAVIVCGSIVTYQDGIGRNAPAANRYTLRFASGDTYIRREGGGRRGWSRCEPWPIYIRPAL